MREEPTTSSPRLDHIALVLSEPREAAARLGRIFGLPVHDRKTWSGEVPALAAGGVWMEFLDREHPEAMDVARDGLHHLGLASDDPEGSVMACRSSGLVADTAPGSVWIGDGATSFVDPSRAAGVRFHFVGDANAAAPAGDESSDVRGIDHVGIASADNDAARAVFSVRLSLPVESAQIDSEASISVETFSSDKYGVVYHARPPRLVGALHVLFVSAGGCDLEFLQDVAPLEVGASAGAEEASSTRRDRGAIARFIDRRGPGLHHVAFAVADVDAALAGVRGRGAVTIDAGGRPGSRRARIGFLDPRSTEGVLFHFVERSLEGQRPAGAELY